MKLFPLFLMLFTLLSGLASCQDNEENTTDNEEVTSQIFGQAEDLGELSDDRIEEASGIAASSKVEDALWVHNDSGNDPELFLISTQAKILKTFYIKDIENRDWEDIALGPGPIKGQTYLYLGEIGDNNTQYKEKYIYRLAEPEVDSNAGTVDTIKSVDIITFQYPESTQNAEALLIDPISKDIYIIAKNLENPAIYRLPFVQQDTTAIATLEKTGLLNIESKGPPNLVTAADISKDGLEVLVKTYGAIYYWKREGEQTSISSLLQTKPDTIAYVPEPQGEAITFTSEGDGFYTLSEKRFGIIPHLFFYPRE
ncbi:hypothetical protein WJR50_04215 [Catalinimonas sp. 4WD22]|uniref:hypothetical protein n=1 Tax=Catalinimonas locisalis TaxID=3133978 RepID=UPI00310159A8